MTTTLADALFKSDAAQRAPVCVDVTDLLSYARGHSTVSGIQRVVIKAISGFIETHGVDSVNLIHFDEKRRLFLRAGAEFFAGEHVYDQDVFCAFFKLRKTASNGRIVTLRDYVDSRYAGRPIKRHYNYLRLRLANRFDHGRGFAKRNIAEQKRAAPRLEKCVVWRDAHFDKDDRILILGATWDFRGHAEALLKQKAASGFKVYQMVHDLIPIVTPEHVGEDVPLRYERYIDDIFRAADVILANSNATANDVGRYAAAKNLSFPRVIVVPLAHEFFLGAPEPAERRPLRLFNDKNYRLRDYLTARASGFVIDPYVLVVGTIESRKNILRLIRIWMELYRRHPLETPTLILAGKPGFGSEEINATLNAMGNLHGKIVVLDRPDDGEVAFLYANCLFSVCVSYYEGWGLPVGESLWFGRPVLASQTSSLPEVGGDLVDYCDPYDDRDIEQKLSRLIFDGDHRRMRVDAIRRARLRSWKDVLLDLWDAVHA